MRMQKKPFSHRFNDKVWWLDIFYKMQKVKKRMRLLPRQLEQIRESNFVDIVRHARKSVPFYRDKYRFVGEITSLSDISKLPIITKEEFKRGNFISDVFDKNDLIPLHTGGSTGKSINLFVSKEHARHRTAESQVFYNLQGISPFDRTAVATCYKVEPQWIDILGLYRKIAIPFDIPIEEQVKIVIESRPDILEGYPSRMNLIARHMKGDMRLKAIFTNSETLTDMTRRIIEDAFKIKVTNIYDSWEFGRMAFQCKKHRGMHINSGSLVFEILDEKKRPVMPGKSGTVVVTDLNNFAMPLIRYEIGDIAIQSDKICDCGISWPLIERIIGRSNDFLVTASKKKISSTPVLNVVFETKGVVEYQMIQKSRTKLAINLVVNDKFEKESLDTIRNTLSKDTGINDISIKKVTKIKRTKNQKLREFISEIR